MTIMSKVLCSLLIISSHFSSTISKKTERLFPRFQLYVINELPDELRVHCASKDDDLGYHTLQRDENIHWSFRENFWGTTLFFCHFWWGSRDKAFDVFTGGDQSDVIIIGWVVKEDGFYIGYNHMPPDANTLIKIHNWN